jgi:hypothetical protein
VTCCGNSISHVLSLSFDVIAGHFQRRPSSRTAFLSHDDAIIC